MRCLAAAAAITAAVAAVAITSNNFSVVAYLPEWRYAGANFDAMAEAGVTHLIFFSVEPAADGGVAGADREPPADVLAAAQAARAAHGMRLLLCVGGNGRSAHFSRVARAPARRRAFARALAERVAALSLDGVDLNWEYPGFQFGAGYSADAKFVEEDWRALALLARDVRAAREQLESERARARERDRIAVVSDGRHRSPDVGQLAADGDAVVA
jgi:GH18 family chitinase